MCTSTITIKCNYLGDLRRFRVAVCSAQLIKERVATIFNIDVEFLRLQYSDSEGDLISVQNDGDLLEAGQCSTAGGQVIRLEATVLDYLEEPDENSESDENNFMIPPPESVDNSVETLEVLERIDSNATLPSSICTTDEVQPDGSNTQEMELIPPAEPPVPGTFQTLMHVPTGYPFYVDGYTLPSGRICFKVIGKKHNVRICAKGKALHHGGEGPWAQFSLEPADEGHFVLASYGNREHGWSLGMDEVSRQFSCRKQDPVSWSIFTSDGSPFTPLPPADWYIAKAEAKAAKAEAKAAKKAGKHAGKAENKQAKSEMQDKKNETECKALTATFIPEPQQTMLCHIVLAGNCDNRAVAKGYSLSVDSSNKHDHFDKSGIWTMSTAHTEKASLWSVLQGGHIPEGLVELQVAGHMDGRDTAQGWTLMVASDSKAPHKRDGSSAYTLATRHKNKKGGFWAIEPCQQDGSKCMLRYAGNRDGRQGAENWYLAVHGSTSRDHRDDASSYTMVTRNAKKASLWEMHPYWGAVPQPPAKKLERDAAGNPKLSFHTTKKVAVPSLQMGLAALFAPADPAVEPPVPTTQSAAAAIHTLRVALHWLKDKTGLPISVGDLSNEEALQVVHRLRKLPEGLPRWAAKEGPIPEDAQSRLDLMVAALGSGMEALWVEAVQAEDEAVQVAKDELPWTTVGDKESPFTNRQGQPKGDLADAELSISMSDFVALEERRRQKCEKEREKKEKAAKQAVKQASKAAEKAAKQAAKEAEKAAKQAAKEAEKAAKQAAKQARVAELAAYQEDAKMAAKTEAKKMKAATEVDVKAAKEAKKAAKAEAKQAAKEVENAPETEAKEEAIVVEAQVESKEAKSAAEQATKAASTTKLHGEGKVGEKEALPAVTAVETAVQLEPVNPSLEMCQMLVQLEGMGFSTPQLNSHALMAADGDLDRALDILLQSS